MNTQHALNRAYAHWLKDGLVEIGLGILFTGVGTLRAFVHFAGEKTAAFYWLVAALFVFMLGFGFVFSRVGKALKARISYPRTGYTAFKPRAINEKRILSWLVLLILGGALGNGVVLGVSFFYLGIGVVLIVTGCVTLVRYLRSHEPVDPNGDSL